MSREEGVELKEELPSDKDDEDGPRPEKAIEGSRWANHDCPPGALPAKV